MRMCAMCIHHMQVFPFMRITLSGLAKSFKVWLDNLRFPFAKRDGDQFKRIVRLSVKQGVHAEVRGPGRLEVRGAPSIE